MVSKEIVATERLCVGSTCINEEQLIGLLQQSGQGYTTTSPSPEATAEQSGGNGEEGETTVEEPVAEESAPEPEPEPEPESQPETETQPEPNEGNGVEGEVTGEGEPASDPVAESSSEPAPEG